MPEITFQEAKKFLEDITSEDKIAIIHHDDGDGFCSGTLFYDWCKNKKAEVGHFAYSIKKSKLKNFNLEKFNKVIVCDLAPDFMAEELELIKEKEVLYVDHHPQHTPVPKEILELTTSKDGYIPSSRTAGELTGLKPWLSLTGTITDSGDLYQENQDFINKNLKQIGMTLDDFKEKVSSIITNFIAYFNDDHNKAFEILQQINSIEEIKKLKKYSEPIENEIEKFVEEYKTKKERLGEVNFYYFEPHLAVRTPVSGIISLQDDNEAYIFASPKDGGEHICFSARCTSQKINMADMLRAGVAELENGSAGGHPAAAGAMILAKDIDKFKENVRSYVEANFSK
jgi:single-stranded DNA-specific DHH superfamily exonuclease